MAMQKWLERFHFEKESTLTLNGKTFNVADCQFLGNGSDKAVYKIKDSNQCFFIPSDRRKCERNWNILIENERLLLNQIIDLGLMAQNFDVVPLQINGSGKTSYTINVLLTKDFESLCREKSIVIFNEKDIKNRVIGTVPDFSKIPLDDKSYTQGMLQEIIKEYALAFTFSLPSKIVGGGLVDDSVHYCFELAKSENSPPIAHYIYWDVDRDFSGKTIPRLPTFDEFKDPEHLQRLAIEVSATIHAMKRQETNEVQDTEKVPTVEDILKDWESVDVVTDALLAALQDDNFLKQALDFTRNEGVKVFRNETLPECNKLRLKGKPIKQGVFVNLIKSAISLEEIDLVRETLSLSQLNDLNKENINQIMEFANKYNNQPIIEFLREQCSEALKAKFLQEHHMQLSREAFGFFRKSYVTPSLSLEELLTHAQGNSKKGNGHRSRNVMKDMGWLDENNQAKGELKIVLGL